MAATATSSDVSDGPVLNFINKRLRALRKKLNRIAQMEEAIAQKKPLNKEQEEVYKSKSSVIIAIEELEKMRQPLAAAVAEEIDLAIRVKIKNGEENVVEEKGIGDSGKMGGQDFGIEEVLKLVYFAGLFDVKSLSDFERLLLTRSHERGCCLSYDHVTDEDVGNDLLGEKDLDMISRVGSLVVSRPVETGLSHKDALEKCVEHAKLWISGADQPIEAGSDVTYALLKEKLVKIMASPYVTTMPEMKAQVEVAGNYGSFQAQGEGFDVQYQQKDEELANHEVNGSSDNQGGLVDGSQKNEYEVENSTELPAQSESVQPQPEWEQNVRDVESKEQQFNTRRQFQNQRGGRGGGARRGYSNGRGGGARRGGGPYQNGRNQYNDQPGNYYPRNNYYSNRGSRGGGRGAASNSNYGPAVPSES
ncbi:hypothetical protein DCAR_0936033 [Daucus carota subsp. sativus]|uniref:Uncharacterized protein n=1 Tax=Daucus carota subsp. sativus TaxID=79200 RepID=A0A175YIF9_DAUCS|nr:PREDICTED: uncharacterized protein LOC108202885 [Daucus carota subsp. sativus]WOH16478.1 hypothetical protein DCAR_0936033 [Daucus carota subsp. sativus]